jgi:hypothetical protein
LAEIEKLCISYVSLRFPACGKPQKRLLRNFALKIFFFFLPPQLHDKKRKPHIPHLNVAIKPHPPHTRHANYPANN